MSVKTSIVVFILVISGFVGFLYFFKEKLMEGFNTQSRINFETLEKITPSQSPAGQVNLSYNCQPGSSAYEILEKENKVEYQGSSFGRMITSINGLSQGSGKYWLYSIDGKDATVSADAYLCQGSEKIEWELK